ncbi:hypothetical protein [Natronosalvus rutilus]|uniref:Uncharacterized protein n=1 Tax=Natronosalvus rutilus TaxID=2953753 RepID=A0A9E7NDH2_9EURY|nr:hypothetical protein [Natronosalvus rutilus]UTF54888.1 hypothetical protein NGM29_06420 [Natronosalvus rutilus]
MPEDSSKLSAVGTRLSRRGSLTLAAGLGLSAIGGLAHRRFDSPPVADASEFRQDFLWLTGGQWVDETVRENLFAFAQRHDLAVVLVVSPSSGPDTEAFTAALESANEYGLDVWLNTGLLSEIPAEEFVNDKQAREAHLEWLKSVVSAHGEFFDSGRVILWQEAPVIGQWVPGGEWTEEAVDNLLELGPEIFAAQKDAVESVHDELDVGLFVHFPYIIDSKRPEVFEDLLQGMYARDVAPAFAFTDFYRGWFDKDVEPARANAALHSLISNARSVLDDRPVFYLAQSHTVNPNHTPNRETVGMTIRTALSAGASGLGWYIRGGYVPTEAGFDPFVPNVPGAEPDGDAINTFTIARDRFQYASAATIASRDEFAADEAFDLWVVGDGFGYADHRLSARTHDGSWTYLGDLGGYADGDYPDASAVTDRATCFHALNRDHFLEDEELELQIETPADSEDAEIRAAVAVPFDPGSYMPAQEAAALVDRSLGEAAFDEVSLGHSESTTLSPGESRQLSIPITDVESDAPTLDTLRYPGFAEQLHELAALEDDGLDPAARFDLWLRGADLTGSSSRPSLVDREGTENALSDVGVVTAASDAAICYGLSRERFLTDGLTLANTEAVSEAYAMPYAGRAAFRPPSRAASLLDDQPAEAERFCLERTRLE